MHAAAAAVPCHMCVFVKARREHGALQWDDLRLCCESKSEASLCTSFQFDAMFSFNIYKCICADSIISPNERCWFITANSNHQSLCLPRSSPNVCGRSVCAVRCRCFSMAKNDKVPRNEYAHCNLSAFNCIRSNQKHIMHTNLRSSMCFIY